MEYLQIKKFAQQPTVASAIVTFIDESFVVGYFQTTSKSAELEKENKWSFIENNNAIAYKENSDEKFATILDGDNIKKIVYPALK